MAEEVGAPHSSNINDLHWRTGTSGLIDQKALFVHLATEDDPPRGLEIRNAVALAGAHGANRKLNGWLADAEDSGARRSRQALRLARSYNLPAATASLIADLAFGGPLQ